MANPEIKPDTRNHFIEQLVDAFDLDWILVIDEENVDSLVVLDEDGEYVATIDATEPTKYIVQKLAKRAREIIVLQTRLSVQRAIREMIGLQ